MPEALQLRDVFERVKNGFDDKVFADHQPVHKDGTCGFIFFRISMSNMDNTPLTIAKQIKFMAVESAQGAFTPLGQALESFIPGYT